MSSSDPRTQLETLSPARRALLVEALRGDAAAARARAVGDLPRLVPDPGQRYEPFPLTDLQQAYWIGRSGAIELGEVSIHGYVEIDCPDLDLDRFELAWRRLVDRHDMLRAVVLLDGRQRVLPAVPPYRIEVTDLRRAGERSAGAVLEELRGRMSHQVLPVERWPSFEIHATLLADRTRLHLSMDALNVDAVSFGILFRELAVLYEDPAAALPVLELSFRDCVLAELAARESDSARRSRRYWLDRVAHLPPAPELPLAAVSPVLKHRFTRRSVRLEPRLRRRLEEQARAHGLTLPAVLLTAYAEVLAFWSKSSSFTLNVTVFHRPPLHPQIGQIIGDFTSIDPLEVHHVPREPFADAARRLQALLWQDLDHRSMSGVEVLREMARARGRGGAAVLPVVFTSMLGLAAEGEGEFPLSRLGSVVHAVTQTPQVWVDHQVGEEAGALVLTWDAVDELFPSGLLDGMFTAYCNLVERLARDGATWRGDRPAIPPARRRASTAAPARGPGERGGTLHGLFLSQAARRPGQPAVVSPSRTLSYGDLRDLSRRWGRRLLGLGAGKGEVVAVVMEKGWQQVVGPMAVLQAGAAYLPLDPGEPAERLRARLRDAGVRAVLTQSELDERLAWPEEIPRLCLDDEAPAEPLAPVDPSAPAAPWPEPGDLAYVIYTSGSTGRPKGVMIEHGGAVNTILDVNRRFRVGPADRVLALSLLSFDLSVYDLFGTLAAGGTIVMPRAGAAQDPAHWAELLTAQRVTVWSSVPALMEMLLDSLAGEAAPALDALRLVLLSGDWIPLSMPDRVRRLAGGARVVSLGGATEASIWSILHPVMAVDPAWRSIPYGRPMAGQSVLVLDHSLRLRPDWVPGRLYIGGAGLARGYWQDEEATRARFIVHPDTGERLYDTGDLGRYLPDGTIELLGREDFQVKIDGHRVECGEIEACLLQSPDLRAAVVTAAEDPTGRRRLVAYVVPSRPQTAERAAFTLRRPGLRRDVGDAAPYRLDGPRDLARSRTVVAARRTHRELSTEPLALAQLDELLSALRGLSLDGWALPKYRYASAGGINAVQTYLFVKPGRVAGLPGGTYYHHPERHELIPLSPGADLDRGLHAPHNRPVFDAAAFCLFLVGELAALQPLYGELARDLCLVEAGYMGQVLREAAPRQRIGLCAIGSMDFEPVRAALALTGSQVFLHALLGGPVARDGRATPREPASRPEGRLVPALRELLRSKLPEALIPARFVVLDELPLTPQGKVDRRALPAAWRAGEPGSAAAYVPPTTPEQRRLVDMLREVTGVERIGAEDNFFDLGASSIHLVRLAVKLQQAGHAGISLADLFQHPTVALLARRLATAGDGAGAQRRDAGHERGRKRRSAAGARRRSPREEGGDA